MTSIRIVRLRTLASGVLGSAPWAFLAIFVFFLAVRWPFRADYLVNWDAVQFALAVTDFRIEAHQPHPPGYIGYIALARAISTVVSDVPAALTLISVVSSALAPAAFFLLARRLFTVRHALVATLLFGFSPLLWYYGNVALTYAPEVALVLLFVWSAHRAATEGQVRDLLLATLLLALLGAVRQSAMVLTGGVWLVAAFAFPWRTRFLAGAALAACIAAWAVPLLWLAGGLEAYLHESAALAEAAGARTSVFTSPISGVGRNLGIMLAGVIVGLHVAPAIIAFAHVRYGNAWALLGRRERWLLAAWAVPSLVVFVLGHTGQLGYVLLVLPVAFIWLGATFALIDRSSEARPRLPVRALRTVPPLFGSMAALLIVSVVVNFTLPRMVYGFATSGLGRAAQHEMAGAPADNPASEYFADHPAQSPLAAAARQYSIRDNDRYWSDVIQYLGRLDPDKVVILASTGGPLMSGSFRHVGYYLPEHRVYGIGLDAEGIYGQLFVAAGGQSTYSMENMQRAHERLWLPSGARWIAIPDGDLASLLSPGLHRRDIEMDSGATITLVRVDEHRIVMFEEASDGEVQIVIR
ncbi:MAG: DUF2723 domain-containing protein [Dehalococcoidia bacterium]|nr:DUF2723 domain-containing protein [Dehalococcoidia bacterium]